MNAVLSLDDILARPDVWSADRLATNTIPAISSGFPLLDAELPGGGWPRGALTEILVEGIGLGECSLLMPALGKISEEGRWSLLIAPPQGINAPAWSSFGIDLTRLVIVAPTRMQDALWASEHALASGALGMVLCWSPQIDARQIRRLQVAASGSNTLAFLFRPARACKEASSAALRLSLAAGSRGAYQPYSPYNPIAINLLKRRGPPCVRTLYLDVPRPLKYYDDHEHQISAPTVARALPAATADRGQHTLTLT